MEDALYAQLLSMGFDTVLIERCRAAMFASDTPWDLHSATEWLLERAGQRAPASIVDAQQAVSSTKDFSSSSSEGPVHSRYAMSASQARDKDRYMLKEREEVLKKARETKAVEIKARQLIKQQIADDRKARSLKGAQGLGPATAVSMVKEAGTKATPGGTADTCRMQVRLPGGKAVKYTFQSSMTLNEVTSAIMRDVPNLTAVQLVQPFPQHEYTSEECRKSLKDLGLCPSASLVVQMLRPSPLHHPHSGNVSEQLQPMDISHDHVKPPTAVVPPSSEVDIPPSSEVDIPPSSEVNLELDQPYSPDDSENMDTENLDTRQAPPPLPPSALDNVARRHVSFNMGAQNPLTAAQGGYRLGGAPQASYIGQERIHDTALEATLRRMQEAPPPSDVQVLKVHPSVQSLESICIKHLLGMNASGGLPSACGSLPPRIVHTIIRRLVETKQLHGKTLLAFHKCPLESLILDNYSFATNDLLAALRYFPTLTSVSLAFCSLITDKAVMTVLPYLPSLTHINFNGCRQLNEVICRSIRGCRSLNVLKLGQVKVSDEGMKMLLQQPLEHLEELDLSYTHITSRSLQLLPEGTPNLQILNIEATQADNFMFLCQLKHLHTLSVAKCPPSSAVGSLAGCRALCSLNLSDIPVEHWALQQLSSLNLTTLKLPSRSTFEDSDMNIVSGFPLISLDLSDYCFITDVGISNISTMNSLTELSLCRTKVTDEGLAVVKDLLSLKQLRLDNTMITDVGMKHLASLVSLDQLSVSDTRVTSQFILDGCLDQLTSLTKLNLSRTAVCDRGAIRLRLPALLMLNLDWTCVSGAVTLQQLKSLGCPNLDTLRVSNVCQQKPSWAAKQEEEPQT